MGAGYIYLIINHINGKIYIGAHQTENLNDVASIPYCPQEIEFDLLKRKIKVKF